ncbi:MAG: adenine nucleotide alpha hydrolase family protein [Actinomycetota bacterium]|nr:adenine nucleotide alpha hydrolase family protein [Actinomycetota bacterium]MDH5223591.1 adenine nucleotide alpha hydrolase family protein [Actinomycetota bacterium]MDH5314105.1 adenine nucleotide alpha hydrolase family protein [Actinomycetota bacterium]
MKCRRCPGTAVIELRRHNAAFCKRCFSEVFVEQVRKAIRRFAMIGAGDRVLVAVSGGKDSLALWDVLLDLGYDVDGLYLGLGIGEYSDRSREVTASFAESRGAQLTVVDLAEEYGYDIPTAGRKGARSTCAVCGLSKRYVFNKAAVDGGYDVIATGHNLDDEAATLLGNTLRWKTEYIARQSPSLAAETGMVKKVKPLHRLSELETAAFAFLRGIDYVVDECPLVAGNTQLRHKEAMNAIEASSPGTKAEFFLGYLDRGKALFAREDDVELTPCGECGQPTTARYCAFCRARAQVLGERLGEGPPVVVEDRDVVASMSGEVMPIEIYGRAPA